MHFFFSIMSLSDTILRFITRAKKSKIVYTNHIDYIRPNDIGL